MYCYLYEALNTEGEPCFIFDAANDAAVHAQLRALPGDKTEWTARFYRRLEADTTDEIEELRRAAEDQWARETAPQGVASAQQANVAPTPQNQPEVTHLHHNSEASAPQPHTSGPIAGPNVAAGEKCGTGATGRHARPPYIYDYRSKAARAPEVALIDEKIVDYYRLQCGFAADLEVVMAKYRLGPTALARKLHVDRTSLLRWKAGTTLPTDPVVFLTVILASARARGGVWGWQR